MHLSRLLAILGLIFIGIASRLLPHPPNFTSINAIALFSVFCLGNRWLSFVIVVSALILSDIAIGFHSTMPYVYLSFSLIILMVYRLKMSLQRVPLICLSASLLFFLITNFGIWMTDSLYPKTINGLCFCYLAALPFLANQILGDLIYFSLLFGCAYFWKNFFQTKDLQGSISI